MAAVRPAGPAPTTAASTVNGLVSSRFMPHLYRIPRAICAKAGRSIRICASPSFPTSLFGVFFIGRRKMALQIHSIVQDASDFDDSSCGDPVHKKVPSATAVSRNVKRAQASRNLVAGIGSVNVGAVGKLAYRFEQRVPIKAGLASAEIFDGPSDDICKIEFRRGTEPNAPILLDHEASYSAVLEMIFSESLFK
jgi:hypothetical protein